MVFFQDVLQTQKLEKVEEITETHEREVVPEGEALVSPEGEALRPPGITMVFSPTLFLLCLCKYLGARPMVVFVCIKKLF